MENGFKYDFNNLDSIVLDNINDIDKPFVFKYCKAKGEADLEWAFGVLDTPQKEDKNGVLRDTSFMKVRREFAKRYFPHLVPVKKVEEPTLKKMIAEELKRIREQRGE